jgi:hypothetical protein
MLLPSDREMLSRPVLYSRLSLERATSSRLETESMLSPPGLNTLSSRTTRSCLPSMFSTSFLCAGLMCRTIEGHSEFISMSTIGMVGWTAYFGAFNVSELKKEHVVVVSGAAGSALSPHFSLPMY